MAMKYFRNYPWGLQLGLLLLMIFTLVSFAAVCVMVFIPAATGVTIDQIQHIDEHSTARAVQLSQIAQGIFSTFMFLLPSLLFAYLTHPKVKQYAGLGRPGRNMQVLLAVFIMVGALPVFEVITSLISQLGFSGDIQKEQEASDKITRAYLTMPTFVDFARTFLVMAIIPALGEELFFRGLLMRFTVKASKSIWLGIVFSSVVFAYAHTNIYGLLSISMAGALLAGIYYLTGSLWCGIVAHMSFNGLQIILVYMGNFVPALKGFENNNSVQWWLVAAGAVLSGASFFLLWKTRTPLPENWTRDFDADEEVPEGVKKFN